MFFRNGDVAWLRFAACLDQGSKPFALLASRLSPGEKSPLVLRGNIVLVVVDHFPIPT